MKKETVLTVLKDIRVLLRRTVIPVLVPSDTRFTKLSDGWVKDSLLGIDWGPTYPSKINWKEAEETCKKDGYRQATSKEMMSLIGHEKHSPAIVDGAEILDIKTNDWYWTSTPCAWSSGSAWYVVFDSGGVSGGSKGSYNYVRPVRSSQ